MAIMIVTHELVFPLLNRININFFSKVLKKKKKKNRGGLLCLTPLSTIFQLYRDSSKEIFDMSSYSHEYLMLQEYRVQMKVKAFSRKYKVIPSFKGSSIF